MRKLKQATQREKARRALKDKKAEPAEAEAGAGPEHRPILYKSAAPSGDQRRTAVPSRKITHH
jgi:hypothetical protein